jgi:predicted helicase
MTKEILKSYLKDIHHKFSQGDAREESYYPIMEQMILSMASLLGKSQVDVTTLPKKTEGGNPDFRVWDGKSTIVGYIEAKKLETDLDEVENSDQLKRYRETFPNLILTNFLEFRFYRDGQLMDLVSIGRRHTMVKIGAKPVVENEEKFRDIFERFFSFTFPRNLNARQLAKELAKRTRFLRDQVIIEELKEGDEKTNYILGFYNAFKKYLIYGLTEEEFADLYSQTVTYGLFAARTRCRGEFHRKNAVEFIPQTIGILHDVFANISLGKSSKHLECIIDDISEVLASVDVGYILDEFFQYGKGDDPIIHFYETFLSEYDPGLREKRGVYYTPEPVVYFIVRSLNIILKDHFKLPKGLADDRIKILDPAAGTLTFIAVAVRIALEEYLGLFGEGVKENFVRCHFLENFYAFELMMAPYAIGHLKMSYILEEKGIHLKENERLKLYLTNTLEMEDIEQINLPFMSTLSEESRKAGEIKKRTPILVILGNPPYSGHSSNVGAWISAEIKEYYKVDGGPLGEKNPKWLQDDYVKFIRFSQWKIDQNGEGVLGFITNHSYLDNPTFRGMRQSLLKSFNEIYILDLHGNARKKERCPDGSKDENVFDISQGTAIALFIKKRSNKTPCRMFHADLWGLRENKYDFLTEHDLISIQWKEVFPKSGLYLFIPRNEKLDKLYQKFFKISVIFPLNGVGMTTARDEFVIDNDKNALLKRIVLFKNHKGSDDVLHDIFNINRKKGWSIRKAWNLLQSLNDNEIEQLIKPVLYRPFDVKWIFYHDSLVWRTAKRIMENMFYGNLGILFTRPQSPSYKFSIFISSVVIDQCVIGNKTAGGGISYLAPLYIYPDINRNHLFCRLEEDQLRQPNIDKQIYQLLKKNFKKKFKKYDISSPEEIFYYIYAVLNSNLFGEKFSEYLKIDFPAIPFTSNYNLFLELVTLGKELSNIHLMKSSQLNQTFSRYEASGDNVIKKVTYNPIEKWVYINERQYFSNIDKETWEYQIGGYQVMEKWLKDRKNRALSLDEIEHYIKIARALQLTIQYQEKIDDLYPGVEENLVS